MYHGEIVWESDFDGKVMTDFYSLRQLQVNDLIASLLDYVKDGTVILMTIRKITDERRT